MQLRRFILLIVFLYFSAAMFIACKKKETYPIEPHIEFMSFTKVQNSTGIDDKGKLKISFTDGDGDVGLRPEDTIAPYDTSSRYHYNFFITYYEKQKGVYKEVHLPVSNNSRIPDLTPSGDDKSLNGEIEIELFINNPFSQYDTIRFDAAIADRALHESNIITTPDIIVKKH
ncbi:MAG: hypothetical protein WCM76_03745 [Bacteroidota bacterium]